MADKKSKKQKDDDQKKNLPCGPAHNTRSKQEARPAYINIRVDLDKHYDASLKETYYNQIYTSSTKVGQGTFGIVYKATNKFTNTKYAIKKFRSTTPSNIKYAEIRNNEKVGMNQNCVKFYMAWEECEEVYMKIEVCQMSLLDYAEKNSIQELMLWDCLFDICKALVYLHNKSLIHKNVKDSNIMIYGTRFKLSDFGTLLDLNMPSECTAMPQESQVINEDEINRKNFQAKSSRDVVELGITLSRLISGVHRSSPTTTEIAPDLSPKSDQDEVKEFSASLQTIVKRMVAVDYCTPPTPADILKFDDMKETTKRWEQNLRTVYTTENLGDLEEKFIISTEETQRDETSSNSEYNVPEFLNLPGCSKDL
ncbi:membrane-associated tyrosine- and threonine-specific cdc2-inhibitory kinase-like [Diabrotica undecimpunctata]|uniref:membrane-associated tyrosine- and threonine-specific cdc2-inhibitory kinase-like n=1 Tax=Diabrotica undecimpunctata TaxID=50387 RepID=UPI003B638865